MAKPHKKITPPAQAGGGVMPAVAGFESARSADKVTHTNIIENLATKQDLEALADRLTIRFLIMQIAMFFSIIGVVKYLL